MVAQCRRALIERPYIHHTSTAAVVKRNQDVFGKCLHL